MADTLIIIEAPGKLRTISKILSGMRFNADVVATGGVLYDLPKKEIGLDPQTLVPKSWIPTSPKTINHLKSKLKTAKKVILMTDADREGELIAAQVQTIARAAGYAGSFERITVSAINEQSIAEALKQSREIARGTVIGVMARRGIDRAIGFLCSNHLAGNQIAGRISSRLLAAVSTTPLKTCKLVGLHPSQPGWRIWSKGTADQRKSLDALEDAFKRMDPALMDNVRENLTTKRAPEFLNGADALLLVSNHLSIPVSEAEKLIQTAYERGALSYPRTESRSISEPTRKMLLSEMNRLGKRARPENAFGKPQEATRFAHEALYPATPITYHPEGTSGLSKSDSAIALISGRTMASLSPDAKVKTVVVEQAAISRYLKSHGLPDVRAIIYRDIPETAGWLSIEKSFTKKASVQSIPVDQAVLERMIEHDIGRPSTFVGHIDKAMKRGWVTAEGKLSSSGFAVMSFIKENHPSLLRAEDLDRLYDGMTFNDLPAAVKTGIERLGLNFDDLRQRMTTLDRSAEAEMEHEAEDSGLPTYEPDVDYDMVVG